MLKAFEPPIDLSQDINICEQHHLDNVSGNQIFPVEMNPCSCESALTSRRWCYPKPDEASHGEVGNVMCRSLELVAENEEEKIQPSNKTNNGSCSVGSEYKQKADDAGGHDIEKNQVPSSPPDWLDPAFRLHVPLADIDKVRCIIRNIVRDWAAEGQRERDECYKPILEELVRLFPHRCSISPPACLVPGAGLGRLALEISCLGFISQGNEFSYYMMICSSFILNHTQAAGEWTIHPWIHSNCNSLSDSDQLRSVSIPDIHPASFRRLFVAKVVAQLIHLSNSGLAQKNMLAPYWYSLGMLSSTPLGNSAGITEGFSMCGGDFVEVYSDPSQVGAWDAVVTCFFLDTAHNIVEYIEIISKILREGGVWINLGPLLYHFADMYGQGDEMSIEPSLEDVKKVALHYGFQVEKEKTIETTYTTNPRSMMQNRYYTAFWTMRKRTLETMKQQGMT
ncbi:unnamed protein product [Ilex paraguariensis]|uniref:carnosine N-methyltransferase n=1 Tax=Ilex paraguariensis TaxID=185542 RepID=A0ABC8R8W5_9AQUA